MKKIIICADDYAQNEFISRAILELIKAERISAVSCMTGSDQWQNHGAKLSYVANSIDVGLHFDLSHFDPINPLSFFKFLLASCFNKIDLNVVEQRLHNQLDEFERVMGRPPDYIDGHQHIHILPNIRRVLLNILKRRYGENLPYLRQVNPNIFTNIAPIKALSLRVLAIGFNAYAIKRGFQLSPKFFGLYSLGQVKYSLLFKAWLQQAPNFSLIMCHPGCASTDLSDPIGATRTLEFNYLASDFFLQDLKENNIQISRWKAPVSRFSVDK